MAAKYYTHFITAADQKARTGAGASEWSGVVELRRPLEAGDGTRELRSLLAQSFDLDWRDVRILSWARLH
jgi:hypothetical protein